MTLVLWAWCQWCQRRVYINNGCKCPECGGKI